MYVITVIPISRGILREHLSYYTSKKLDVGMVVWVPLRKREVPSIVVSVEHARLQKAALKDASFQLRKITVAQSIRLFSPYFIRAVQESAHYFLGTSGSVLHALVPKAILDKPKSISAISKPIEKRMHTKNECLVLQRDEDERSAYYRNAIREEFAHNQSIFLCVPTIQETDTFTAQLSRGIEPYVFTLHGSLSKSEIRRRWNAALKLEHPVLIIATGSFLSLPRTDIGTYMIEHESSRFYKQSSRPFIDIRTVAEFLAQKTHARIIFSDILLRIETLYRYKNAECDAAAPVNLRQHSAVTAKLIDMRTDPLGEKKLSAPGSYPRGKQHEKRFEILSEELTRSIEKAEKRGLNVFLFATRRGLAPITVCEDCGNVVVCKECLSPVTLHKKDSKTTFLCHKCGAERGAAETCRICSGWKLKTLGIGTQRVLETLREHFPDIPLFAIESDVTRTHKQAKTAAESFYRTKGAVLVGTEMALSYLTKPVEITAVVSMDSMLSIPEIRISERALRLLLYLKSRAEEMMIVQTRQAHLPLLAQALRGNIADFYRDEIRDRERFEYPPFCTLVTIAVEGTKAAVEREMRIVQKTLKEYNFSAYPTLPSIKGRYIARGLLRTIAWPDRKLHESLIRLSPRISIIVDPEQTI